MGKARFAGPRQTGAAPDDAGHGRSAATVSPPEEKSFNDVVGSFRVVSELPTELLARRDVGVHAEDVVRVVLVLERREPC